MNNIIDLSISSTCFEGVYSLDTNTTNSFPEDFKSYWNFLDYFDKNQR